jgi:hypothetical protein
MVAELMEPEQGVEAEEDLAPALPKIGPGFRAGNAT